jgi:hypothetical protein
MYSATFKGPMLSMSNCEIRIAGVRVVGVTKADMEDGLKAEAEFGTGPIPLGSALGQWEGSFSMDQHEQEADALRKLLNSKSNGAGFALAEVNVSFTFNGAGVTINGLTSPVKRVELLGVRFLKPKAAPSNDGKSIITSWSTLLTRPISWDGIYSINPDIFATSNSISIGAGGTILISG